MTTQVKAHRVKIGVSFLTRKKEDLHAICANHLLRRGAVSLRLFCQFYLTFFPRALPKTVLRELVILLFFAAQFYVLHIVSLVIRI